MCQENTGADREEAVNDTPSSGDSDSSEQGDESDEDESGELTAALQRVLALETYPDPGQTASTAAEEANDSSHQTTAKPGKRRNRYKSVISQVHEHAVRLGMNVEFEANLQ